MTSHAWFITGINSGFGRSLTEQLLARGDQVFGTVRRAGSVDDLTLAYPRTLRTGQLDVTDTAAVRRVVGQAFADLGRIDVVVNNAGYGLFGAAEELTDAQVEGIIATNLLGSIQVSPTGARHSR